MALENEKLCFFAFLQAAIGNTWRKIDFDLIFGYVPDGTRF